MIEGEIAHQNSNSAEILGVHICQAWYCQLNSGDGQQRVEPHVLAVDRKPEGAILTDTAHGTRYFHMDMHALVSCNSVTLM